MTVPKAGRHQRYLASLIVALATAAYAAARVVHEPSWPTDFDQLWHAGRALVQGEGPYDVIGPGHEFVWNWPLYYPLPAVVLALPLVQFPVAVARVIFSTIAGAVLGFSLGERIRTQWPLLLSAAYIIATSRTQWAPLLLAACWLPFAGAAIAAKPNVGLAVLAFLRGRALISATCAAAAVTLISTILRPSWIGEWRVAIAASPHIVAPIFLPGGFLLLLAALRYRRADARLLLALALMPHTPSLYDLLPLFVLARTQRECTVLAVLTHILFWSLLVTNGGAESFDVYAAALGRSSILLIYLPALVAVLLRPNVYEDPAPAGPTSNRPTSFLSTMGRIDFALTGMLVVGATMLVWLPLVTTR